MANHRIPEETINEYIKKYDLQNSFIEPRKLYLYRKAQPIKKEIGTTNNGDVVFFEETLGSIVNRHKGTKTEPTSWNLVYCNGYVTQEITQEWLESIEIYFTSEYDKEDLINFLSTKTKRTNPLKPNKKRKQRTLCLFDDEYAAVKDFLRNMRIDGYVIRTSNRGYKQALLNTINTMTENEAKAYYEIVKNIKLL